jgi:hypothetical protein
VGRLGGSEHTLPLGEGLRETGREGVRDVVVPRNDEVRRVEALEDLACPFELGAASPVREIAGG